MMHYWKNTNTLDSYCPELLNTVEPSTAEIAVLGSKPINLENMPRLRGVFKCGVGTDNLPIEECNNRGIKIGLPRKETAEIIFEETACFTIYLILKMLYAKSGLLESWTKYQRPMLMNRKALVIGAGNIGSRVKNKLSYLMQVSSYDTAEDSDDAIYSLLLDADVVSLHIPLNTSTRDWFDADKMACMKNSAILVNTARGQIVNENDLLKEIKNGRLKAAFDVFWKEPYTGELRRFHPDSFFMTPHIASTCENFLLNLADDLRSFAHSI